MEPAVPIVFAIVGASLLGIESSLNPGRRIVGMVGAGLVAAGAILSFEREGLAVGAIFLAGYVAVALVGWFAGGLLARLRDSDRLADDARRHRDRYLGRTGRAVTPLRPSGVAEVDGERIDVSTEGEFIAEGSSVRVVAIGRKQFFVRLAESVSPQVNAEGS